MGSWGPVLVTAAINLVAVIYVYGRLTEKVSGVCDDIKRIDIKDDKQDERLDNHNGRISNLEGSPRPPWKGYH